MIVNNTISQNDTRKPLLQEKMAKMIIIKDITVHASLSINGINYRMMECICG